MAALIFLTLFWALPAAGGIGLAYLTRRRRARAAMRPRDRSRCAVALVVPQDNSPACAPMDDGPAISLASVTLPDTLPVNTWSAVVLERLRRLTTLALDARNDIDGAELIRRATYATYLDCVQLGLGAEARALMARTGRHTEVTNV